MKLKLGRKRGTKENALRLTTYSDFGVRLKKRRRMRDETRVARLLLVMLVVSFCKLRAAHAQDIYNFYFQKAPGPQTVIQGYEPKTGTGNHPDPTRNGSPEATESETNQVRSRATATPVGNDPEFRNWSIGLSQGRLSGGSPFGTSVITGQYRYNKYVGVMGQFLVTEKQTFQRFQNSNEIGTLDRLDFAIGGVVTPIHTQLFGWDFLNVSLSAGLATAWRKARHESIIEVPVVGGGILEYPESTTYFRKGRELRGFIGASMDVNFSDRFSTRIEMRQLDSERTTQSYLGFIWRI